jgi:hypothetical protein
MLRFAVPAVGPDDVNFATMESVARRAGDTKRLALDSS